MQTPVRLFLTSPKKLNIALEFRLNENITKYSQWKKNSYAFIKSIIFISILLHNVLKNRKIALFITHEISSSFVLLTCAKILTREE